MIATTAKQSANSEFVRLRAVNYKLALFSVSLTIFTCSISIQL